MSGQSRDIYLGRDASQLIDLIRTKRPEIIPHLAFLGDLSVHIPGADSFTEEEHAQALRAGRDASLRLLQDVLGELIADDILSRGGFPDTIPPDFGAPPDAQQRFEGEQR